MKKAIFTAAITVAIINLLCATGTALTHNSIMLTLTITMGTFLYHMVMRLIVGYSVPHCFEYHQKWFNEIGFEKRLYKTLGVKKWKKHMPSFSPDTYSTEKHTYEEIANTTCRNEVIHGTDVILSFVPLFFTTWFGSFGVFLVTSIFAALCDLTFVIMQRYNRPRIVKLIKRQAKKNNK